MDNMSPDEAHKFALNYYGWDDDDTSSESSGPIFDETEAEKIAINYAFDEMGMVAVNADTVLKNIRSQHILDKIGFQFLKEEGDFRYYRLEKEKQ